MSLAEVSRATRDIKLTQLFTLQEAGGQHAFRTQCWQDKHNTIKKVNEYLFCHGIYRKLDKNDSPSKSKISVVTKSFLHRGKLGQHRCKLGQQNSLYVHTTWYVCDSNFFRDDF